MRSHRFTSSWKSRLRPNIRNEHLQYAITWYGLAAVLIVMLLFWVRTQRRDAG